VISDQVVDVDLAFHVPVDDPRHVGAAAGAAERGALPSWTMTNAYGRSPSFTFPARMRTERIARLCRGWDWPLMTFSKILVKTIRGRVRGERSCKSKRWIHADIFAIKPTMQSTDFRPRHRAYPA
jgi:hypothetical protein